MKTDDYELQKQITKQVENSIGGADYEELARQAYNAYGRTTDFKNFQGGTMPAWENLPELIKVAWTAAVKNGVANWVAHIDGDLGCFLRAFAMGEPTFTLRAQDASAFATIMCWILNNPGASTTKLREAFSIANRMREWPAKKAAD